MRAVTGGGPKELAEVGRRPVIQYILEEALDSGAERTVVVTSEAKPDLNRFLKAYEPVPKLVFQPEPTGLAPAVFLAGLKDDAVVLLPDALYHPQTPSRQIARALAEGFDVVLFTETVKDAETRKYGIFEMSNGQPRILEKPQPDETESRDAIGGRSEEQDRACVRKS